MPDKIPQKQTFFRKIISNIVHSNVPKEPQVHSPPDKDVVEEPKQEDEAPLFSEVLDSEGHRAKLNRHPRNPFQ
ncbi:hypothetical protein [Bdellovibrio bacteriovorus]|uniref:hypothetical protein n=1 Tax=Bdellovibrio bacteriovorus TaxID=959 RepID=UPI0035A9A04B